MFLFFYFGIKLLVCIAIDSNVNLTQKGRKRLGKLHGKLYCRNTVYKCNVNIMCTQYLKPYKIHVFKCIWIYLNLYNKTRHSYIYVVYSRPNGSTDWAEIFCGHSLVAGGVL